MKIRRVIAASIALVAGIAAATSLSMATSSVNAGNLGPRISGGSGITGSDRSVVIGNDDKCIGICH